MTRGNAMEIGREDRAYPKHVWYVCLWYARVVCVCVCVYGVYVRTMAD